MAGREDIFQQAMNRGHTAAWDQQWERAASYYRQALEEFPEHPGALTSLGLAFFELQAYPDSFHCYLTANKVNPEDPLPVEKIAQIYERMSKIEPAIAAATRAADLHLKNKDAGKAIDNWKLIIRLNPENIQAHTRLALLYERTGNKNEAVGELLILAALFQHSNEADKALQAVNYALQMIPGNTKSLEVLATLRDGKPLAKPKPTGQSSISVTLDDIQQLEAPKTGGETFLDPVTEASQKALEMLAGMLFEKQESQQKEQAPRKGIQAIVRSQISEPTSSGDISRTIYYISQLIDLQSRGEYTLASRELERAMDEGLDSPAAYFDLGWLHYQNGRIESALRILQHAINHPEFTLGTRLLNGRILGRLGKMREAAIEYMRALSLADAALVPADRRDDLLHIYEPLIETFTQETDQTYLNKVCENINELLDRNEWRLQLSKTRQQLDTQRNGASLVPIAEMIIQARSGQVVDSLTRINELAEAGHFRSAMEEAFYALEYAPSYLPLHSTVGDMLVKENQLKEAIDKFMVVALAYSSRGEAGRAVEYYRKVIKIAPFEMEPRRQLIAQLNASGQIKAAVIEQIELAEVCYNLADLDMARKIYSEAIRQAQQQNIDRSLSVQILHRLADIYMQSLDWRQALRVYEQICQISADDDKARSSLIDLNFRLGQETKALAELDNYITYLTSQGQRDKVVRFLEMIVSEIPSMLPARRRLAAIYKQLGLLPEAVEQLDIISESLLRAGNNEGAMKVIEEILAMNPVDSGKYQQLLYQIKMGATGSEN